MMSPGSVKIKTSKLSCKYIPKKHQIIFKNVAMQFPHLFLQKQLLSLKIVRKFPYPPVVKFNIVKGRIPKPLYFVGLFSKYSEMNIINIPAIIFVNKKQNIPSKPK